MVTKSLLQRRLFYCFEVVLIQFFIARGLPYAEAIQLSMLLEGATSLAETIEHEEIEFATMAMVQHM